MLSQYGVRYVSEDKHGKDYFWLVPDLSNGATNKAWIRVPAEDLMKNIFGQTGKLVLFANGVYQKVYQLGMCVPASAPNTKLCDETVLGAEVLQVHVEVGRDVVDDTGVDPHLVLVDAHVRGALVEVGQEHP